MTKDELICMARDAGWQYADDDDGYDPLWRFAALVETATRNNPWTQEHWTEYERSIADAEREACAVFLEDTHWYPENNNAKVLAEKIRARGQA